MDTIAGSLHMVPAHAIVTMFGFSPGLWQLTITAGTGYNIFPGFQFCFAMSIPLSLLTFNSFSATFSHCGATHHSADISSCQLFVFCILYTLYIIIHASA